MLFGRLFEESNKVKGFGTITEGGDTKRIACQPGKGVGIT